MINRITYCFIAMALACNASALDLTDAQRAEIEARIKPAGEVCLLGENCDAPPAATAVAASADVSDGASAGAEASASSRSGEEVYNTACMACHATGAAGAPILGDAAAWADRIAKGTEALYTSAISGIPGTGMMAKGGCMGCSDEEITAAVDYMVVGSQ